MYQRYMMYTIVCMEIIIAGVSDDDFKHVFHMIKCSVLMYNYILKTELNTYYSWVSIDHFSF